MNNTSFESYLQDGCGRCGKFQTPECKVHSWTDTLAALRELLLSFGLEEAMKWGSPCYMVDGKNVLMLASFKEHCALSFLKGAALADEDGLLESAGPNSRIVRMIKFRSLDDLSGRREQVALLIQLAIDAEKAGVRVEVDRQPEPMPEELEQRLIRDPLLAQAFDDLTPGRQRSHILYVGGAKQSATREARVERCVPKILEGRGFNER